MDSEGSVRSEVVAWTISPRAHRTPKGAHCEEDYPHSDRIAIAGRLDVGLFAGGWVRAGPVQPDHQAVRLSKIPLQQEVSRL